MPYSIIIADDHPFTAEGMENVINEVPALDVVGIAQNGIDAIGLIKRAQPDCAMLDLSMPGANGLEVFQEAKRWSPKTRFVIVTGLSAASLFRELYEAGIDGIFVKNDPLDEITSGIVRICKGARVFSKTAHGEIVKAQNNDTLSKREIEVLRALAQGKSNKEIALDFGVSPKTINTHRTNLLRKMNVNSTAALLVSAIKAGILDV
ncbi:LuxR C-terminal-related transcriptional regulator [Fretibacter rubidus]|uniref:LuxR C-terminal-related transcriptional regulator n=1 Tax=Fretibacter rubidus TaxID=570162 RepID=UPI00352A753B